MRCFDRRYPCDVSVYITSLPSYWPTPVILTQARWLRLKTLETFSQKNTTQAVVSYISHATVATSAPSLATAISYCQNINPNISQVLEGGSSHLPQWAMETMFCPSPRISYYSIWADFLPHNTLWKEDDVDDNELSRWKYTSPIRMYIIPCN